MRTNSNNNSNSTNNEYDTNQQREYNYYMQEALKVARTALRRGEVPVGCIIVYNPPPSELDVGNQDNNERLSPKILSYGTNRVNATRDATRHAELVALDRIMCQGISSDQLCLPESLLPSSTYSSPSTRADTYDDTLEQEYPWNPSPITTITAHGIQLPFQDWSRCDLYVTCEPCIMCAAAIREIGVARVFFGCYNERFGGCGSILSLHRRPPTNYGNNPPNLRQQHYYNYYHVTSGILQQEAISLLQQFYQQENCHAPTDRRKRKKKMMILSE